MTRIENNLLFCVSCKLAASLDAEGRCELCRNRVTVQPRSILWMKILIVIALLMLSIIAAPYLFSEAV